VAHKMFGYTKTELRGKNITMIMPPVLADNHTTYIRNYISTGDLGIRGSQIRQAQSLPCCATQHTVSAHQTLCPRVCQHHRESAPCSATNSTSC
jgi:hypothetical protein